MLKNSLRALSACTCVLSFGQACASGFVDDSHADLTMRNFYFDRNYVNATPQAAAREWAQGFVLNVRSGYTEGPVGFGLDAQGLMGVHLDSSRGRTGTGLLPYSATTREPADEYSELGLTAKVRASKSELQLAPLARFCRSLSPALPASCHRPSAARI